MIQEHCENCGHLKGQPSRKIGWYAIMIKKNPVCHYWNGKSWELHKCGDLSAYPVEQYAPSYFDGATISDRIEGLK